MIYRGKYKVTQAYKGIIHQGIDLVGLDSKNIYSPVSGTVIAARKDTYFDGGMGNYVKIQDGQRRYHLFAHLSQFKVKGGQMVKSGDLIGVEGNTGHSFGSHCHYEIRSGQTSGSFMDVAKIMGIPNKIGTYGGENMATVMTKAEAKQIVKDKLSLSDATIQYIADDYRYGDELIIKIATALEVK